MLDSSGGDSSAGGSSGWSAHDSRGDSTTGAMALEMWLVAAQGVPLAALSADAAVAMRCLIRPIPWQCGRVVTRLLLSVRLVCLAVHVISIYAFIWDGVGI